MPAADDHDEPEGPDEEATSKRNALTVLDWVWLVIHIGAAAMDGIALSISFQRRHKGAFLFGGHTQFLGNWNAFISIASHSVFLLCILSVEPFPDPHRYVHRERQRRESLYRRCARLYAILIPFSAVATLLHCLLFAVGELNWPGQDDIYELWFHFGIAAFAWFHFVAYRPKVWMYSPSRFILRQNIHFLEIGVGQSGVHSAMWLYVAWVTLCRLLSGRWAYTAMNNLQRDATGISTILQYAAVVFSLQAAAWVAWRFSRLVAPRINQ